MESILERRKKSILSFLFLLTGFLILFRYTSTPKVWVDEGIFTNIAETVANQGVFAMQTDPQNTFRLGPLSSVNYPVLFPVAVSLKIFGNGIWQSRLPMVIYMFLLVLFLYLFTKKNYGFYHAICSVLLLISFAPFYGNGRPVIGEVPGLAFLLLGSIMLFNFEKGGFESKKFAILAALFLGLAATSKSLYLLVLTVGVPLVIFLNWKAVKIKRNAFLFLGVFCIPLIIWFLVNCPTVELMKEFIPALTKQAGNNGASSLSGTSLSTLDTAWVNFKRFFTESTPILFTFLSVFVILFFIPRFLKKDTNFSMSETLIFFVIGANWVGYLVGTGWYRYFFPAQVLLFFFFPASITAISKYSKKDILKKAILAIPILLIIFQFTQMIFYSDVSLVHFRTRNSELAKALSEIPSTQKVLFYNAPEAIVFLKGSNYSQYLFMADLFEAGDINITSDPSNDYILMGGNVDEKYIKQIPFCYEKVSIDKYSLFRKLSYCKNK